LWGTLAGRTDGVAVMANAAPPPPLADENSSYKEKAVFKSKAEKGNFERDRQGIAEDSTPNLSPEKAIRENLNETAFFLPDLRTDSAGNISFEFTMPEALTQWKFMALAHDVQLSSAFTSSYFVTQKPLMLQPNWPRFVREGDRINIVSKIANITEKELTGTAQLELYDAITGKPVDGWFKNVFPNQYFTVAAGQSVPVEFPIEIPYQFDHALGWRIKASTTDQAFSDGEGGLLPVLSNRILVTGSMPLFTKSNSTKNYRFEKLLNNSSTSLSHQSLTLELTANPVWLVVQAIPYLAEFPYECAEQSFNRYLANSLGAGILKQNPTIAATLKQWQITNSPALLSNLQKNQDLKSTLLQETPWVLQAQQESEQKNRIAQLLDRDKLQAEKQKIFQQLTDMQRSDGAFSWFKGGPDNRYITQYILSGIGHLFQIGTLDASEQAMWKPVVTKGLQYLDQKMQEDYMELKKNKKFRQSNQLHPGILQYLYMRSFFLQQAVAAKHQIAYQFYLGQTKKYGLKLARAQQAMAALILFRNQSQRAASELVRSLKENAIVKEEMGMYWKEWNQRGYWWYQAPIENQALMIEAFAEISRDTASVDAMKTWLLQQKRTSDWGTTKATAEACYALLLSGQKWIESNPIVSIEAGHMKISSAESTEAGTGYLRERIPAEKVKADMGNIRLQVTDSQHSNSSLPAWGAVYWQYFEDLDRVTGAETPLSLQKNILVERNSANGPVLQALDDQTEVQVGDKLTIRLILKADRDMEFVHLKDMRAAGTEPVNVLSGYRWQGGLAYYESTGDAATNLFFDWLPKGTYVFEYPL
ncbi:MAG TPA: alpha-2-macroglobulin family protein, partial [Ferruginibacter sp.]|nr:alpha-2-macroglobulin family protein [Ferruginibacter sp.]